MIVGRGGTWLDAEELAYTARGAQRRAGQAIFPDGRLRRVYAGIADTFFSVPAHGRVRGRYVAGFLTVADQFGPEPEGALVFRPYERYKEIIHATG